MRVVIYWTCKWVQPGGIDERRTLLSNFAYEIRLAKSRFWMISMEYIVSRICMSIYPSMPIFRYSTTLIFLDLISVIWVKLMPHTSTVWNIVGVTSYLPVIYHIVFHTSLDHNISDWLFWSVHTCLYLGNLWWEADDWCFVQVWIRHCASISKARIRIELCFQMIMAWLSRFIQCWYGTEWFIHALSSSVVKLNPSHEM